MTDTGNESSMNSDTESVTGRAMTHIFAALGWLSGLVVITKVAMLAHEAAHIIPLKLAGYDVLLLYTPSGPGDSFLRWSFGQMHVIALTDEAPTLVLLISDLAPLVFAGPAVYVLYDNWVWVERSPFRIILSVFVILMLIPSSNDLYNTLNAVTWLINGELTMPVVDAADAIDREYVSIQL